MNMSKPICYNWILRIVDRNGERYESRMDYTLANMRYRYLRKHGKHKQIL